MTARKSSLIPAGCYIRMSTDSQEDSPRRQKEDNLALAKREGVEIVVWYDDHGKSGTVSKGRDDFQRMLNDAEAGRFKVLLASEMSRLSREDYWDSTEYFRRLKKAGVKIITGKEGRINWDDIGSIITTAVHQYGSNDESKKISYRVVSGKRTKLRAGELPTKAAFAYDREIVDEKGTVVRRVHFRENFRKPSAWKSRLVISADVDAVEGVRFAYAAFREGKSLREIARGLNSRGLRTIKRNRTSGEPNRFQINAVKSMLTNPIYIGTMRAGVYSGKPTKGREVYNRVDAEHGPYICERSHEAIIDEGTFHQVQSLLRLTRKHVHSPTPQLLTKMIRVVGCGCSLYGYFDRGENNAYYVCNEGKKRLDASGGHFSIRASAIDRIVLSTLSEQLSDPNVARQLRASLAAFAARPKDGSATDEQRLARLDDTIEKVNDALFGALSGGSRETIRAMTERLDKLRIDRETLAQAIEGRNSITRFNPTDAATLHDLQGTIGNISNASQAHLRRAIEAVIEKIEIKRETTTGTAPTAYRDGRGGKPTRERYGFVVTTGKIFFKPGLFPRDVVTFGDEDLYPNTARHRAARLLADASEPLTAQQVADALGIATAAAHYALKCAYVAGVVDRVKRLRGGAWVLSEASRAKQSTAQHKRSIG